MHSEDNGVAALQALRGIAKLSAVTIVSEVGRAAGNHHSSEHSFQQPPTHLMQSSARQARIDSLFLLPMTDRCLTCIVTEMRAQEEDNGRKCEQGHETGIDPGEPPLVFRSQRNVSPTTIACQGIFRPLKPSVRDPT